MSTLTSMGERQIRWKTRGGTWRRWAVAAAVAGGFAWSGGSAASADPAVTHTTANLSLARSDMGAGAVGNVVLFAGGATAGGTTTNRVDIYNVATGEWTTASLSQARFSIGSATWGSKIFFGGGYSGGLPSNVVDIYDYATNTWSTANLSQARGSLAATTIGDNVIFAGGNSGSGRSNVVDIYNGATNTWSTSILSMPRFDLAAASVGNVALFAGGYETGQRNRVDIYDNSTVTWSTANLSVARDYPASATIGTKAYFVGGRDFYGNASNVIDVFDGASGTWSAMTMPYKEYEGPVASAGPYLVVAGGYNTPNFLNNVSIWDSTTNAWYSDSLTQARCRAGGVSLNGTVFIAGGDIWGTTFYSTVDIFTVPEPATLAVLGIGVAAILMRRRGREG